MIRLLRETMYSELAKWSIEFKNVKPGDEVLICVSPDKDTTRYSALVTHLLGIDAIPHVMVVNTPKDAVGLWSLGRGIKLPRTLAMATGSSSTPARTHSSPRKIATTPARSAPFV